MNSFWENVERIYYFKREDLTVKYLAATVEEKRKVSIYSSTVKAELGEVVMIHGNLFSVRSAAKKGNEVCLCIHPVSLEDDPDDLIEHEITCPYCRSAIDDSFIMPDEEARHHCGNCGSVFSYTREVLVEYCCFPVEKNETFIKP